MNITPLQSKVIRVSFVERRRIMITTEGFIKFLQFLPVLAVVEAHPKHKEKNPPQTCAFCKKEFDYPRQLKYCSAECRVEANNRKRHNDYSKERHCVRCESPMPLGKHIYCSDKCFKEQQYANNRNPLSTYGTGGDEFDPLPSGGIPTHYIASTALEQAELYTERYGSGIQEDMDELNQIIMQENNTQPAVYEENIRSPEESGKLYWSVKQTENQRRKRAGLPKLPTIRSSHLDQELVDHNKRKKKNPVIAIREENYQTQKNKGFATIGYNPHTKSGMLKSKLLKKNKTG
jgi:hypothetical protein